MNAPPSSTPPLARRWLSQGLLIALLTLLSCALVALIAWKFDAPVAQAVHNAGIDDSFRTRGSLGRMTSEIMKTPGEWYSAATLALVVLLLDKRGGRRGGWRAGAFIVIAALASSANSLVKWIAGRQRPYRQDRFYNDSNVWDLFHGGAIGLFKQSNLSFVSGHSAQSFALATALILLYPRWGWLALPFALMTASERVLSNSHYLSEVVGGGILGAAGAYAVWSILRAIRFWPASV